MMMSYCDDVTLQKSQNARETVWFELAVAFLLLYNQSDV